MHKVAIVVNSKFGQTEKIGQWLRQRLNPFCDAVHIYKITCPQDSIKIDLTTYDLVIIGAPVYKGSFSQDLTQWAKTFSAVLHCKTTALFTVSGNAGDRRPQARAADDFMLRKLMNETGLHPTYVASFGGAIHYTKYNFFLRWMMKKISKKAGGSTDTSHDIELTNWNDVDDFVHAILDEVMDGRFGYSGRFGSAMRANEPIIIAERPAVR